MKSDHFHLSLVDAVVTIAALVIIGSGNVLAYLICYSYFLFVTEKILCRESSLNEILSTFFH